MNVSFSLQEDGTMIVSDETDNAITVPKNCVEKVIVMHLTFDVERKELETCGKLIKEYEHAADLLDEIAETIEEADLDDEDEDEDEDEF